MGGRVVEVEEAAGSVDLAVGELQVVQALQRDEAVGARQARCVVLVGSGGPPGDAGVRPAGQGGRGSVEPEVGDRATQTRGVLVEVVEAAQRIDDERVLVLDVGRAAVAERASAGPGSEPCGRDVVDARELVQDSSGTPSTGDDARAYSLRGIRPAS